MGLFIERRIAPSIISADSSSVKKGFASPFGGGLAFLFASAVALSFAASLAILSSADSPHPTTNKPIKIGISTFIAEKILHHHPDPEKFRELVVDTTV